MAKTVNMKFEDIKVVSPFKDLFAIDEQNLEAIEKNMDEHDYDMTQPIIVWKEESTLLDGHTRYQAAKELFEKIPVTLKSFSSEKEAVEYAIHLQTERRNLTDWDILTLVELIDERSHNWGGLREASAREEAEGKEKEGKEASFSNENLATRDKKKEMENRLLQRLQIEDSHRKTAVAIGISMQKVSMCRAISKCQNQNILNAIKKGEMTLSKAYNELLMWDENKALRREEQRRARAEKMDYDLFCKGEGREAEKAFGRRMKHLDNLSLNIVPELLRKDPIIKRMQREVQYFTDLGERAFEGLHDQKFIQEFLTSPFLTDFISILEMFGFSIQWPEGLKPVKRPEPKKKEHPVFDISQVHGVPYARNEEFSKYGEIGEQAAESDVRAGRI